MRNFAFVLLMCSACADSSDVKPGSGTALPGTEGGPPLVVTPTNKVPGTTQYQSTNSPPPDAALTASACGTMKDGGALQADGCITAEIHCGDIVKGHTLGGTNHFDTKFYEKNFCTPATTDHNGGDERVYVLKVPDGDHKAVVTLDTPCADLDLAAFKHNDTTCPAPGVSLRQCDMWPKDGTERERVELVSQSPTTWWIVVEGKGADQEGEFALTIECRAALQ